VADSADPRVLDDVAPDRGGGDEGIGRREQILQAAQKLFANQGFVETNLNDVATQLGFRRQAVYHYFPSKEEILYELIARAGTAVEASAQSALDADLPPADKLAEIVRNHVRQVLNNVDVFRIQFSELSKLSGDRADALRRQIWGYVTSIARVIEAGQKDGTFTDVSPITQTLFILSMCDGTTEWYQDDHVRLTIDQIADHAAKMALSGAMGVGGTRTSGKKGQGSKVTSSRSRPSR
jgi:AcrR family transcriptional regulator